MRKYKIINASWVIVLIAMLIAFTINSCRHDSIAVYGSYTTVYFTNDVLPIFQTNCAIPGCHDGNGGGGDGNLMTLNSYDNIIQEVQKGNPQGSRVYTAITSTYGGGMPPNKPLREPFRSKIRLWILEGALNNTKHDSTVITDTTSKTPVVTAPVVITPVAESYPVCFNRDILPVIKSNCSSCHAFTSYNQIVRLVSPGNPGSSNLYKRISTSGRNHMPPSGNLSKANIDSIYNWILNGAKNDNCPTICDTTLFTFSGQISSIIATNCASCHSGSSPNGWILLSDYSSIATAALNGKLMNAITQSNNFPIMPPSGALSNCDLVKIEKWVNAGAPNN